MSTATAPQHKAGPPALRGTTVGRLGRLGVWVTRHGRMVGVAWLLVVIGLGAFAPQVESSLSGAGWQADGS